MLSIRISQDDGTPIYQQLMRQVKLLAATGRLAPGEQLPSVRKLAEQLLINPNTVARAYRELEAMGVVSSRRGAGVFVSDEPSRLSRRERTRRLNDRIDALLAEAVQLDFDPQDIAELVRQRSRKFGAED